LAKKLALSAGEAIKNQEPGDDAATSAAKESQQIIVSGIKKTYPSHTVVTEAETLDDLKGDIVWLVNPMDGMDNFSRGLHCVTVNIGLRYKQSPIMGVVHFPISNETYTALQGQGAFLNDKRCQTSKEKVKRMNQAMVFTEYERERSHREVLQLLPRLEKMLLAKVTGIRTSGCTSADMCFVASGRADLHFEGRNEKSGTKATDVTAGQVIITEAGGVVMLPEGAPFDCTKRRILCANGDTLAKLFVDLKVYKKKC
jgi:myo-inositol-1(or 4)-monophosphatase